MSVTIKLSSRGVKNLNHLPDSGEYFTIHYSENNSFQLLNNNAEFISPKISELRRNDPTCHSIHLNYHSNDLHKYFTNDMILLIKSLASGNVISIDETQRFKLLSIAILFDNSELFNKIKKKYKVPINEHNFDNFLQQLIVFYNLSQSKNQNYDCSDIIDHIASNFYSIEKTKILQLPNPIIYLIISNENLKLEDEDSLVDFIHQMHSNNEENNEECELTINDFLNKVCFLRLSEKGLKEAFDLIDYNNIHRDLMMKVFNTYQYYKNSLLSEDDYRYQLKKKTFVPNENNNQYLNGIIRFLTESAGGNVHDKGVVNVTASSVHEEYHARNACDLDAENFFISKEVPNSWILFDLLDKKIHPTHYSIKCRHDYDADGSNPKNWLLEGSNTGNEDDWKKLDERKGDPSFRIRNTVQIFDVKVHLEPNESFKFLRITQNGLSTDIRNYFVVGAIEFFGDLFYK